MMYADQQVFATQQYAPTQYAFPVHEQEASDTSGWSNVAMLAVAGAVVGGVIGHKKKQAVKRTQAARTPEPMMKETLELLYNDARDLDMLDNAQTHYYNEEMMRQT